MTDFLIENVRVLGAAATSVWIVGSKIAAVNPEGGQLPETIRRVDGGGGLLTPGLIDLHTHGIHTHLYENSAQDILDGSLALGEYGTTCVLPTLYTVMRRQSLRHLRQLAEVLPQTQGAAMPGFHLEGPFLALPGAGADTVSGDLVLLEEVLDAAMGRVLAMSVSPDTPNILPVIERLCELQIAPFITHTHASAEQTRNAIAAGARHATHFYNVFPIPEENEPGVRQVGAVEALLVDKGCTVDFICDGVHVDPLAVRLALVAKGVGGVILITDSNIGTGMPAGVYEAGRGKDVRVVPGDAARIADLNNPGCNGLAGSILTMDVGIDNLRSWLDLPEQDIWAMGTSNPAKCVGLTNKGCIAPGYDADMVLWHAVQACWCARQTWVAGRCVFDAWDVEAV